MAISAQGTTGITLTNGQRAAAAETSLRDPQAFRLTEQTIKSDDLPDANHHAIPANFSLSNTWIDEPRRLRVAVIGAGLAGITAGVLLPAKVPNIDLTIFDKNNDVSGTWLENVYPGVRCDIPAHVYQSTFSPNTQWTEKFAQGHEIREYWQSVARKYDVYKYLRLRTKIEAVNWDNVEKHWKVKSRNLESDEVSVTAFDFVLPAIGRFNAWRLPSYPGIDTYRGHLRHTSNYDPSYDATSKRIAIIGNGASGIQLLPNLQPIAAHIDHYARNRTWIAGSWAGDERTFAPQPYSEEERLSFQDIQTYISFRKDMEDKYWRRFRGSIKDSPENIGLREQFIEIMRQRLKNKPQYLDLMVPDFSPNCRRLTPGPGYLEALAEDNVEFIQDPIQRFTENGIVTADGQEREVDAVFCATGANVDMVPTFSIEANGVDLSKAWRPDGEIGWPKTYLGLAAPTFPNLLFIAGPHGTGPSGTVPHSIEIQLTYYAKLLRKVASQGIQTITPSEKATNDFVAYSDAFFDTTVFRDGCSSWANGGRPGARIHGHWPGSAAHVTIVRKEPRWEDWEYEYVRGEKNRFAYLGLGWTKQEMQEGSDMTGYLRDPEQIDLRNLHEAWHELP